MSFYTFLNLTPSATQAEIKSSYRKLALLYHPDKQGDPLKFKELSNIYSILSDPEKKAKYDCFGENKIEYDENNNTYVIPINLTLEQCYSGYIHKQKIFIKKICEECILNMDTCPSCSGSGKIVKLVRTGPFTQQMVSLCDNCISGQIKREGVRYNCALCINCILYQTRDIEINFNAGDITNLTKNVQAGDTKYVFVGKLEKHERYTILEDNGVNLEIDISVPLGNSLTETFVQKIPFLDGSEIIIAPKFIISHGDKYICKGKGLTKKGNLIINFKVVFPESFSQKRKDYLKKIFGIDPEIKPELGNTLIKWDSSNDNERMPFNGIQYNERMPFHGIPHNGVQVQSCAQQ